MNEDTEMPRIASGTDCLQASFRAPQAEGGKIVNNLYYTALELAEIKSVAALNTDENKSTKTE